MSRLPLGEVAEEESQVRNVIYMMELDQAPVSAAEVKKETEKDPVMLRVREFTIEGWPDELTANENVIPFKKIQKKTTMEDGVLLWGGRAIVPEKLRERVLEELNEGHVGMKRMKMLARGYCWWPGLDKQIEAEVAGCDACQEYARNPAGATLHPWEMPSRPWSRIHIDHAGPFLGRQFLIITDSFTKWVDVYEVPSTATEHVIQKLRQSSAIQGLPDDVVSDNATSFISSEFKRFAKQEGFRHTTSAPYHPSSNGAAERVVQNFKQTLKKLRHGSKESIATQLSKLLFAFRHTPSTATGLSPAEMLFLHKPQVRLSRMKPDLTAQWKKNANKMINSRTTRVREFQKGDPVMVRSYRQGEKWMTGTVVERPGPLSYKVKVDGGIARRHIDQVRGDQRTRETESIVENEFEPDTMEDKVEEDVQEQAVPERLTTLEPETARSE